MFLKKLTISSVKELPLPMLASLGDAVSSLYERERAINCCTSAKQMHLFAKNQVNAQAQANFLDLINPILTEQELDLIRRARNIKPNNYRQSQQALYRKATAFEVLIGYLYLTDQTRLKELWQVLEEG